MKDISNTFRKLVAYRERLDTLKKFPGGSSVDIMRYEREIDLLEGELLVEDLKCEMDLNKQEPNKVETDCWETVDMLCREERVVDIDVKWSWRFFKIILVVKFYYKKRF